MAVAAGPTRSDPEQVAERLVGPARLGQPGRRKPAQLAATHAAHGGQPAGLAPRIIRRISLNCLSSWLTSVAEVPLPRAIRTRREPSTMVGSARSALVIERTMASIRETWPSSIWSAAWRISLDMPGMSA